MYKYRIHTIGFDSGFSMYSAVLDSPIEDQLESDKSYIKTAKGRFIMKAAIIYIEDKTGEIKTL